MTMSRDIKHTKSATQATQHTENINRTKIILNSFGLSLNSLGSCDGWLNATSDCILCTYIQKLKSLSVCLPYDPPPQPQQLDSTSG